MTDHAAGPRRALSDSTASATGPADGWDAHVGFDVDDTPLNAPGDLAVELFRTHAAELIDWIAKYLAHPEQFPVVARVAPGDIARALPTAPPRTPEPFADILADFQRVIVPGLTHWNHPGFHAYFANSASIPGILGELLTSALNQNAMLWKTSPAATELEQVAMDWLRQLLGLGRGWFGMITDTASISTFLAIAAAREARPELDVRGKGLVGRPDLPVMRVYCSSHAHTSVDKAVMALGLGHENCVHIAVDEQFRMRPDALATAIADDVARGMLPICIVATVGTTSVAAIDPVPEIAEIARAAGAWLHVDAAYGGAAAVVPELAGILDGVDEADSVVMNPHKWLFVPMDCSALWVKHPEVLKRAFSLVPEYLVTREQDAVINYMDYGVQLGRRFRALKLWMVMRAYGADGLAARVRQQIALTRTFASWVRAEPHWEVIAPVHLSLACIRHAPPSLDAAATDAHNERIMHAVNAGGEAFLSHNKTNGQLVLRFAIGNIRTDERHVRRAWELLRAAAAADLA